MEDQWIIAKYNPEWSSQFIEIGTRLRNALQQTALRIDHVGSTSIPGLDAKPILDIQISIGNLGDTAKYVTPIEEAGFVFRSENADLTKRYFRERPGHVRMHLHVRQAGSFAEQMTLLFRDYLRQHPEDCVRYAEEKHRLMQLYKHERSKYVEGKGPVVWEILQRAHLWSQATGWKPGESDIGERPPVFRPGD
jgi:GrpB-like predicted nucleotidyltransferase (UPF0157 family)